MKKLLFLLSLVVITLSSCQSTMTPTKGSSNIPYEVVQLAQNSIGDSVLLIETMNTHYIVKNGIITQSYDVRDIYVECIELFAIVMLVILGCILLFVLITH